MAQIHVAAGRFEAGLYADGDVRDGAGAWGLSRKKWSDEVFCWTLRLGPVRVRVSLARKEAAYDYEQTLRDLDSPFTGEDDVELLPCPCDVCYSLRIHEQKHLEAKANREFLDRFNRAADTEINDDLTRDRSVFIRQIDCW